MRAEHSILPAPAGLPALLISLALVSCASAGPTLEKPLPFRVALMPVEIGEEDLDVATEASFPEDRPRLDFDEAELQTALLSTLRGRGFTDVVQLDYPEVGTIEGEPSASEQFVAWMDRAKQVQADLLMRVQLQFEPNIEGETNEKFWLNLPLFLLGGPFCYFINDRTYTARARLKAEFFSVAAVRDQRGAVDESAAAVLEFPLIVWYEGSQLDFIDRAGRSAGSYALSLLIPAGLLARNSDQIQGEVHDKALEELTEALLGQIASQQAQLNETPELAGFKIDFGKSSARRASGSTVTLAVSVTDLGGGLRSYLVRAGTGKALFEVPGDLSQKTEREREIRENIELPSSEQQVQLEIFDGDSNRRSYTFRVEPGS